MLHRELWDELSTVGLPWEAPKDTNTGQQFQTMSHGYYGAAVSAKHECGAVEVGLKVWVQQLLCAAELW